MAALWRRIPLLLMVLLAGSVAGLLAGCGGGPRMVLPSSARYEITGQVTTGAGSPVATASVALAGSPIGVLTDDQGHFRFGDVRPGDYRLTVLVLGYRSRPAGLRVPETGEGSFTLDLVRDPALGEALARDTGPVTVTLSIRSRS